jgi:hypothetical protein
MRSLGKADRITARKWRSLDWRDPRTDLVNLGRTAAEFERHGISLTHDDLRRRELKGHLERKQAALFAYFVSHAILKVPIAYARLRPKTTIASYGGRKPARKRERAITPAYSSRRSYLRTSTPTRQSNPNSLSSGSIRPRARRSSRCTSSRRDRSLGQRSPSPQPRSPRCGYTDRSPLTNLVGSSTATCSTDPRALRYPGRPLTRDSVERTGAFATQAT